MQPTLFRRDGCQLCDHAEEALRAVGIDQPQSVDIGWDGELADRYGQRIPVLQRQDGAELSWPFDAWTVKQFLAGA